MNKPEFRDYLAKEISAALLRISPTLSKSDKVDWGRVAFLKALKAVVDGAATPEDVGTVGAVNDVAQVLGLLQGGKTLLAELDP
ncbi:hypothetical protein IQK56_15380 [Pseudomonas sp. MAFF 301449]|jgi:hypothetical protein|uniref:Uncharacterized protein n=1 Tax=Pseudomonas cyclaminis TaxID=2781239 RepID=A0ABR9STN4_9PSED|nr:hypothetical protein [Pseudomonas cyclaminis]MBE8592203.1 hypothetical protein [Pseudomonas cyclaminis]MBE8602551.1 hypothetical protein [Pseudomonas cyclaminis]VVN65017.1 hypothetical protein PS687_05154 [Pseudomonas fluorescens]